MKGGREGEVGNEEGGRWKGKEMEGDVKGGGKEKLWWQILCV